MKKRMSFLFLTILLLTGCEQTVTTPESNGKDRFPGMTGAISIVTDQETGCKYLREYNGQGVGITALLKSDGTPDCEKK